MKLLHAGQNPCSLGPANQLHASQTHFIKKNIIKKYVLFFLHFWKTNNPLIPQKWRVPYHHTFVHEIPRILIISKMFSFVEMWHIYF